MKIAIIGANGFIGHNLIDRLLRDTAHEIVGISKSASGIPIINSRLTKYDVDVFDTSSLSARNEVKQSDYRGSSGIIYRDEKA